MQKKALTANSSTNPSVPGVLNTCECHMPRNYGPSFFHHFPSKGLGFWKNECLVVLSTVWNIWKKSCYDLIKKKWFYIIKPDFRVKFFQCTKIFNKKYLEQHWTQKPYRAFEQDEAELRRLMEMIYNDLNPPEIGRLNIFNTLLRGI
jgi:hypothetical protein